MLTEKKDFEKNKACALVLKRQSLGAALTGKQNLLDLTHST
jgi:hypothetical protein